MYSYYDHRTCIYNDHGAYMYYDHSNYMCYDHNACMYCDRSFGHTLLVYGFLYVAAMIFPLYSLFDPTTQ